MESRYAYALYGLACSIGQSDRINKDMTALQEILADHTVKKDFHRLLNIPQARTTVLQKLVDALVQKLDLSDQTERFLHLLIKNRRMQKLPGIIATWQQYWNNAKGQTIAQVTSAVPLSDEEQQKLWNQISEFEKREVKPEFSTDPTILGGLIVKIGSKMVDGSIRSKLNALELIMKQ